jgi:hypothetical protein
VTALHAATEYGHASCLEALLDVRAAVDVADGEGNTPLIVAARVHAHDCVQVLLSHGAGSDFENDAGMTALDVARHCVQSEGSTPELEDIIHALEIADQAGSVSQEEYGDDGFDGDIPHTLAGAQKKHWKVAATAAIAVGRMQRTILFIVTNQCERHAVEVTGLSETTLAQLQQKIEAVLNIPVAHQDLNVKDKPVATMNASARLSQLGIEAMTEIVVQDHRLSRKDDIHEAAAQHYRLERPPAVDAAAAVHSKDVVTSNASASHFQTAESAALAEASPAVDAAAATHTKDVGTSNVSASHFQSAETAALRAQVQQLQMQLQVRQCTSSASALNHTSHRWYYFGVHTTG